MLIAVIGDYVSPGYKELLVKVRIAKPEEEILDLSRHNHPKWIDQLHARFTDISNSGMVIIGSSWRRNFEAKRDVTHAQSLYKDCYIEVDGQFRPFPECAERI